MDMVKRLQTPLILSLILLGVGAYGLTSGRVIERVVIDLFINLLLVIALQMFMGNSGVVSFAHIGFMGIGAYTAILFTLPPAMKGRALRELYPFLQTLQADFIPALLIAGVFTALVAAVLTYPLMRLSGSASVIATFALLVIIHVVLKNWTEVTNGPRSVFGVESYTTLPLMVGMGIAAVFIASLFKQTSLGLKLRASREDEKAASSIGINIVQVRWIAFIFSAFITGIAGALHAHFVGQFGADEFYLAKTFLVLSMLIIGGSASVSGATAGVIVVTLLTEGFRQIEAGINLADALPFQISGAAPIIVSLITILMLILRPDGILGGREVRILPDQPDTQIQSTGGDNVPSNQSRNAST